MMYYIITPSVARNLSECIDTCNTIDDFYIVDAFNYLDSTSTATDPYAFYCDAIYDSYVPHVIPLPTNGSGCIIFIPWLLPNIFIEEEIEVKGERPLNVRQRSPPGGWRYNYIVKL